MTKTAPYGSWKSPITSEAMTASSIRLEDVVLDGSAIYWSEQHPNEKGAMPSSAGRRTARSSSCCRLHGVLEPAYMNTAERPSR